MSDIIREAVRTRTIEQPDQYDWWRRALAGEPGLSVHHENPEAGFYRMKSRDRDTKVSRYVPVAYWFGDDGGILCRVGDNMVGELRAREIWPWVSAEPIAHAIYQHVLDGGEWPDIDAAVARQIAPPARGSQIGGNNPPSDPAEILKDQIESAARSVAQYAKIADDETLAKAQTLRSRLLELGRDADKRREAEKRPHLEAGQAIDRKWQPLVKDAKAGADALRSSMSAWETEKLRRRRKEERKAAEAAQAAALADKGVRAPDLAPPCAPPSQPVRAAAPIKGAFGRAASSRAVKIVTGITDKMALFAFFQDAEELLEPLRKLAQRAVDAGQNVPGVTVEEQAKIT